MKKTVASLIVKLGLHLAFELIIIFCFYSLGLAGGIWHRASEVSLKRNHSDNHAINYGHSLF